MKTFRNKKQAEREIKKLLQELEFETYEIRIEQWSTNKKGYWIDADISRISLYGLQCLSELLGDTNPTITSNDEHSITLGSCFKVE